MRDLRAYMAFVGDDPGEGACLVFAHNARDARRLAFPTLRDWLDAEWVEVRTRWLKSGCPHLRRSDEPHIVDDPPTCKVCELWYEEPLVDGLCEGCADDLADGEVAA